MNKNWIDINDGLPTYYKCVLVELKSGVVANVWRASTGDYNIWTECESDYVYYDADIRRWKHKK